MVSRRTFPNPQYYRHVLNIVYRHSRLLPLDCPSEEFPLVTHASHGASGEFGLAGVRNNTTCFRRDIMETVIPEQCPVPDQVIEHFL